MARYRHEIPLFAVASTQTTRQFRLMSNGALRPEDLAIRGALTALIAELGFAPSSDQLAKRLGVSVVAVEAGLRRLHDAKGAVMTIPGLWAFAQNWYGSYLEERWHKRSRGEALALFSRHGLTSDFWAI